MHCRCAPPPPASPPLTLTPLRLPARAPAARAQDLVGVVKHSHLPGAPSPADLLAASTAGRAPPAPPAPPPIGTRLACRVLDVSRSEGIVDLSARADLTAPLQEGASGGGGAAKPKKGGKKAKGGGGAAAAAVEQPAPGTVAEGVVELVHEGPEHYAVVCLAGLAGAPLAAVALTDFNAAAPGATRCGELREGARVTVTVAEAAGPATGGRLLATLPLFGARGGDAGAGGAAGAKQSVKPGSVVLVRVVGLSDAQADVVVGKKLAGRIHVSQMRDAVVPEGAQGQGGQGQGGAGGAAAGAGAEGGGRKRRRGAEAGQAAQQAAQQQEAGEEVHLWRGNPLEHLAVGQVVEAVVLGRGGAGHHGVLELCMRPSVVEAAKKVRGLQGGWLGACTGSARRAWRHAHPPAATPAPACHTHTLASRALTCVHRPPPPTRTPGPAPAAPAHPVLPQARRARGLRGVRGG